MDATQKRLGAGDVLTISFGTTVAMWALGYLSRLPGFHVPSAVIFGALIGCFVVGAFAAGALTKRGWRIGLASGILIGILNLLILGSLLASTQKTNALLPSTPAYIGGFIGGCAFLGMICAGLGTRLTTRKVKPLKTVRMSTIFLRDPEPANNPVAVNWTGWFARVAAAATMLLITVGGVVTSEGAGLSVVDWPNSFGYNMFLYPISRMTGGIYFEHAHRLIGSLVGLTVVTLAIHLWVVERRTWLKVLSLGVIAAVICQGILGGLRVTGYFTLSDDPSKTAPNIALAIVHGVFGQLIFGAIVGIAVFTSRAHQSVMQALVRPGASADRSLGVLLVVMLMAQLIVGAILRHISHGLALHITMAVFALALAVAAGTRAWFLNGENWILRRCGKTLLALAAVQLALGLASIIITQGATRPRTNVTALWAGITTAHQAVGALLLAMAVTLAIWNIHLLRRKEDEPERNIPMKDSPKQNMVNV